METLAKASLILLLFALTPYILLSWGLGKERLARFMFWVFFISLMIGWNYLWSAANHFSWQSIFVIFLIWYAFVIIPVTLVLEEVKRFYQYFFQGAKDPSS